MRATASDVSIDHYRLSRVEYDRAVEAGAFEPDAKVELIDGDLNAMTPEGVSHTTGIDLVADCLRRVFGSGFHVRIQHPLAVDDYSEPEPDVAVVKGTIRDYAETHPREAVLVVAFSDSRLCPPCPLQRRRPGGLVSRNVERPDAGALASRITRRLLNAPRTAAR